jgi:hypothetical protein
MNEAKMLTVYVAIMQIEYLLHYPFSSRAQDFIRRTTDD